MIFNNIFNNNNFPIEKYILSVLNKNKNNVELSYNEIYNKYPMLKKKTLKDMITAVLENEVKNNKITGIWKQIDKKWKLYNESDIVSEENKSSKKVETEKNVKQDMKGNLKGEALPWSGPELPASNDPSSIGDNLHTYSHPQGQPRNLDVPEQTMKHDVYENDNDYEKMQMEYEELFNGVCNSVSNIDIKKLNEMLLEELAKTYGSMIVKIKLKK
jgi:hypothetical protein